MCCFIIFIVIMLPLGNAIVIAVEADLLADWVDAVSIGRAVTDVHGFSVVPDGVTEGSSEHIQGSCSENSLTLPCRSTARIRNQ
jgi:hypothetical protein